MNPEQWRRIKPILESALELGPTARRDFLDTVCIDTTMKREIDSLLLAHDQADPHLLIPGSWQTGNQNDELRFRLPPGKRVGSYEILEEIAQGGMGAVYRATRADGQYSQQVAIKIVRTELGGELMVARFRNEQQILARFNHQNIARILDGGLSGDGLPYFVMEFIDGLPITEYCDQHTLTVDERLTLFRTVCSAVHYAHQHLVIHRDIKPLNIMVTSDGMPKLLDFGIAKILDPTPSLTEQASGAPLSKFLMTPEYASPEQFRGDDITTATDIYSLGLVLYELLAGRRAYRFSSSSPQTVAHTILERDPEKPSTSVRRDDGDDGSTPSPEALSRLRGQSPEKLQRQLSGDLDNITLKAIRKEPAHRYSSVEQFSEDIRRHLEGLPVLARKSTVVYRFRKYVRRHKIGVVGTALIFLSLLAGIVSTWRIARIARANELRAERRFNDVRQLADSLIFEMHDSIETLPGATNTRNLLVSRALQYLDSLAKEASGDIGLERELAAGYERLGDVECQPRAPSLGDSERALRSYKMSLNLREGILQNDPGSVPNTIALATISRKVSQLLADSGDLNAALEHASRAVAVSGSLPESGSAINHALTAELLADYIARGIVEYNSAPRGSLQRPGAALEDYRHGLKLASKLLSAEPSNHSAIHQRAIIQERIGRILLRTGKPSEALSELSSSLATFRTLALDTNDAPAQRNLAASLSMYGDALSFQGRFNEALQYYRDELAIFHKAADADPNDMNARMSLAGSFYDVGACLMRQGRLNDSLALIRRARAIHEEVLARDVNSTVVLSILGEYRITEAETLDKMQRLKDALDSYGAARMIYDKILRLDAHNVDAQEMATAVDARIGATLLAIEEPAQAEATLARAVKASESAAHAGFPDSEPIYTLAFAYSGLGDVASYLAARSEEPARRATYWTEAKSWYENSLRVWRSIPNRQRFIDPNGFEIADLEPLQRALRRAVLNLERIGKRRS